jgi:hypothetical protein
MRIVTRPDLARFLARALLLAGPLLPRDQAPPALAGLGMLQVDSIRRTGLRNHELAWLARAEGEASDLARAAYVDRLFLEVHHPVHLVRRDLVPMLITNFAALRERHRERRRELASPIRQVRAAIAERGAVMPRELESDRVIGGFNTVKATTKALETLFYAGELMIAGRSPNFDRLFDLTERVAPELAGWRKPPRRAYEDFLAGSALEVLKAATPEQIVARLRHHHGPWRTGLTPAMARAAVDRLLDCGVARPLKVRDRGGDGPVYWYRAADEALWDAPDAADPLVRVVPPLDNLLMNRRRLKDVFGLDYLFEAYKPVDERRFYFGMPLLYESEIVGVIDACRTDGTWSVEAAECLRPVPADALRRGVHRIARLAGAVRVVTANTVPRPWRKILAGRIED